jgi:hypothetical protein
VEGYDLIGQNRALVSAWWTDLIGEKIYPGWIPFFMTSLIPSKILSPFDDPCISVLLVSTMVPC